MRKKQEKEKHNKGPTKHKNKIRNNTDKHKKQNNNIKKHIRTINEFKTQKKKKQEKHKNN